MAVGGGVPGPVGGGVPGPVGGGVPGAVGDGVAGPVGGGVAVAVGGGEVGGVAAGAVVVGTTCTPIWTPSLACAVAITWAAPTADSGRGVTNHVAVIVAPASKSAAGMTRMEIPPSAAAGPDFSGSSPLARRFGC